MNLRWPLDFATVWRGKGLVWLVLILGLFVALFFLAYYLKRQSNPLEYEGRIIDKWAGYNHSEHGSIPYFKIHLETENGQRLIVSVDDRTYNRARVGMWIKRTPKGIELMDEAAYNLTNPNDRRLCSACFT